MLLHENSFLCHHPVCFLIPDHTCAIGQFKNLPESSAKDSLANASIQLFGLPDSALLQSQVSNASSNIFSVKPFSKYLIEVSAIGFETKYKTIAVANKALTVILEIKSKSNALDSVIVVAKKPLIKQEDDKTIVDAEVLANSSTNAYEVLEKTPGAVVDQDGNVYLTSSTLQPSTSTGVK